MLDDIVQTLLKINELSLDKCVQILLKHQKNRAWIIGNGGSSSTASHFTSDLASLGFDAVCLSDNVPRLTALANDYGWEDVYIKQLQHMEPNDVLITLSVHGGDDSWSNNLVKAALFAKGRRAETLSLLGFDGGELAKHSDFSIIVPAEQTYIIEGIHSILTHVICQKIEDTKQEITK